MANIAVVGSRRLNNFFIANEILSPLVTKDDLVVSGGATGVDSLAEFFCEFNNIRCDPILADWDTHGKSAGYIRNHEIISRADKCIYIWDGISKGTNHSIKLAKKKGIPTYGFIFDNSHIIPYSDKVVHVKHNKPYDLYVGRGSAFGNPYKLTDCKSRLHCISKYIQYHIHDKDLLAATMRLEGKTLACWCRMPDNSIKPQVLCHGDYLHWYINHINNPTLIRRIEC